MSLPIGYKQTNDGAKRKDNNMKESKKLALKLMEWDVEKLENFKRALEIVIGIKKLGYICDDLDHLRESDK